MDARSTHAEILGADQVLVTVGITRLVLTIAELQSLRVDLDGVADELGLADTAGARAVIADVRDQARG